MQQQNPLIKTKVSVIDTLAALPKGCSVVFDCRELGLLASAKTAASRLNKAAGYQEFVVHSEDNGATYTVTRNP